MMWFNPHRLTVMIRNSDFMVESLITNFIILGDNHCEDDYAVNSWFCQYCILIPASTQLNYIIFHIIKYNSSMKSLFLLPLGLPLVLKLGFLLALPLSLPLGLPLGILLGLCFAYSWHLHHLQLLFL